MKMRSMNIAVAGNNVKTNRTGMEQVKWECTTAGSIEKANEMGKEGWEPVGFYYYGGYTIMLKRQIQDNNSIEEKGG